MKKRKGFGNTKHGQYRPVAGKCLKTGIVNYRSSYELAFCVLLDSAKSVTRWEFEQTWIRYTYGRQRSYLVDFTVYLANGKRFLIEIKPKAFYDKALVTKDMNYHKWEAAKAFANNHDFIFRVVTEDGMRILATAWQ
jgi:hypothetical protein